MPQHSAHEAGRASEIGCCQSDQRRALVCSAPWRSWCSKKQVSISNDTEIVLVVMHDLWGRQRIAGLLVEAGYPVLEASNGASGIRLAEQHQPDSILLPGRLPDLVDSAVVLDEMHRRPSTRTIRVMIVDQRGDPLRFVGQDADALSRLGRFCDTWSAETHVGVNSQPADRVASGRSA